MNYCELIFISVILIDVENVVYYAQVFREIDSTMYNQTGQQHTHRTTKILQFLHAGDVVTFEHCISGSFSSKNLFFRAYCENEVWICSRLPASLHTIAFPCVHGKFSNANFVPR